MFEEVAGIPAHPLLVHAPVVFVPLLAIGALAYAFIAVVRPHTRWVLGLLAIATPVSTLTAKLSGDAFFARLDAAERITAGFYPTIEAHQRFGTLTLYATIALAVLTLALVYFVRPGGGTAPGTGGAATTRILLLGLRVLTVVAAAVSLYYIIRTGDSGAKAVWTGY